ncbi:tyrosine-type recombinase/integrase [Acidobacteriota bacterium]
MTPIAIHMTAFLGDYLARQRGSSQHTCDTYAYSFQLLFEFASKRLKVPPSAIYLEQVDTLLVTAFLEYLEGIKGCTASTRNVRLAVIKSFFRFLEFRLPAALDQIRRILAIPFKKTDSRLVPYLNQCEMQALLDAPNLRTRNGCRDYAMIQLTLAAGLRVSELIGLRMEDLTLQPTASVLVRGKGRRERVLPLWKETATALRYWLAVRGDVDVSELFVNSRGEPMSRWGFAHILRKYVQLASQQCPSLTDKRISPHVLRHTCAIVALQATQDIRKVSLWLGHSSTQTTEVYVRTDPSEKLEAINAITPPKVRKGRFRPPDKLIALLKAASLCGADTRKKECRRPGLKELAP